MFSFQLVVPINLCTLHELINVAVLHSSSSVIFIQVCVCDYSATRGIRARLLFSAQTSQDGNKQVKGELVWLKLSYVNEDQLHNMGTENEGVYAGTWGVGGHRT